MSCSSAASQRGMILVDATSGEEAEPVVVDAKTGRPLDDSRAYVFAAGPAARAAMRARCPRDGGDHRR